MSTVKLALDGGSPVRTAPMPNRGLFASAEKEAIVKVMDEAIAAGNAPGYNGAYEQQYEADFCEYMGGGFADGVNSGTNAVFCALGGLNLPALSEVICPAFTDPGGIMPVVMNNLVPVVADTDPRTFNICAEEIEKMITERTRAILVAHIMGEPADMDPIMALAKKHNLFVVEDCAQSHGAEYKGRKVGTIGHIAAFSTMFGKHHCTGGQGGVVYTRDEKLAWQARRFADRGKPFNLDTDGNVVAGLNCNSNDMMAAIGSVQIKKLPEILTKRRELAEMIRAGLKKLQSVSMVWQLPNTVSSYWFLQLKLDLDKLTVNKDKFCEALQAEGISAWASYRVAIPALMPWFQQKNTFGGSGFPWNCSDYQGAKTPLLKVDNAIAVDELHFRMPFFESYGPAEIADILTALQKIEKAYLK
ncbi:DegT/DnrJ/EryC1/StrS family aminotransferase [bacterium]|nr:DegT/DnrJ/EryC1/StrS family aminotransferase [bacterium]